MKGLRLRKIVGLFALVLCCASGLVAHVWKQNTYVRMSMESVRLAKASAKLRNGIALLEIEAGDLRKLSRIESLARSRFGLETAGDPVPVYPEGARMEEGGRMMAGEGGGLESGKAGWLTRGL